LILGDRNFLWLDEPFANWNAVGASPVAGTPEFSHWYHVPETRTWIGTERRLAARPVFWRNQRYAMVAPVNGSAGEWLVWTNRDSFPSGHFSLVGSNHNAT
jgi:hypothetical protein